MRSENNALSRSCKVTDTRRLQLLPAWLKVQSGNTTEDSRQGISAGWIGVRRVNDLANGGCVLRKALIVLASFVIVFSFLSCAEEVLVDKDLNVTGAKADVQFRIGDRYGIVFNDTDIVIEDNVVIDGVCSNNHVEYGIDGFAGLDNAKGYFLPLEILDKHVDDTYKIESYLMGKEVLADILYSGGKYYAVIRLQEGGGGFDFNHGKLEIIIENRFKRFIGTLELLQRSDTSSAPGLLLKPAIASV